MNRIMKSLLTVFVDGLKPESLKHMPFINSFETKRKTRTELGYSLTCYASMWSGVYPNKHHIWFSWKYSPDTSPYKWLRKYRIDGLPHNPATKYALFKISDRLAGGILPWQGPMPLQWYYVPISSWHYFDTSLERAWFELNFLKNYPTVFDILKSNDIQYELVGIEKEESEKRWQRITQYNFSESKSWTMFFIGEIDHLSHRYGQDSEQVIRRIKEVDAALEEKYNQLKNRVGDFDFFLFSDHGHIKISETLNLKSVFKSSGDSLDNYIYFIDANFARFWFRDADEEKRVNRILSQLDNKGYSLTEKLLKKYHTDMPDNRYGDLIFYVEPPCHLTTAPQMAMKIAEKRFVSMHGYSPDHPDSYAVFVSNKKVRKNSQLELVDIAPSILDIFGLEIPEHVDGKVIWK